MEKRKEQFKIFRRRFYANMNKSDFEHPSDYNYGKLEAVFDKINVMPCHEHGLENKNNFTKDKVALFKDKFINAVIEHKSMDKVWLSSFQLCKLSKPKEIIHAVFCEMCETRDALRFSNKNKQYCNLCRAVDIRPDNHVKSAAYENHIKLCNLNHGDVERHAQHLRVLDVALKEKAHGDPFRDESSEDSSDKSGFKDYETD